MSLVGQHWDLILEENADFPTVTIGYYPSGYPGTPFDFTGYTAQAMFRVSPSDASPVLTTSITLGGSLGTVAFGFTHAQVNALVAAFPIQRGCWDILLTLGGVQTFFFAPNSNVTIERCATR